MARRREKVYEGPDRRGPAMVLVVNDDDGASELLKRVVTAQGYRVELAASHEQALTQASNVLPRACILDLTQGGVGSNLKLLEAIRHHEDERVATTRVVLIARQAANRVFSFQSGADAFIVRPFHIDELVKALDTIMNMPFKDLPQHRRAELERDPRRV